MDVKAVFLAVGVICLFLAGFKVPEPKYVNFFYLGWAFLALGFLFF